MRYLLGNENATDIQGKKHKSTLTGDENRAGAPIDFQRLQCLN